MKKRAEREKEKEKERKSPTKGTTGRKKGSALSAAGTSKTPSWRALIEGDEKLPKYQKRFGFKMGNSWVLKNS